MDSPVAQDAADSIQRDRFGLPKGRFVGRGKAADGRSVGSLTAAHLDAWGDGHGGVVPNKLPDIVECMGPGGSPLRGTRKEYLASVAPTTSEKFAGGRYCDGSVMGGLFSTFGSDGVQTIVIDGQRGSVDDEGYVLDSEGRRLPSGLRVDEQGAPLVRGE